MTPTDKIRELIRNEDEIFNTQDEIDYKVLLGKYMMLVINRSNYDYLNGAPEFIHSHEWQVLRRIAREVR